MIKHVCDICNKEAQKSGLMVDVHCWNESHWKTYCMECFQNKLYWPKIHAITKEQKHRLNN